MLLHKLLTASELERWQVALLAFVGLIAWRWYYIYKRKLDVPAVGVPSGLFGPWKAAITWITQSEYILREGFSKYGKHGLPFKVSALQRYYLCITKPEVIREIRELDDYPDVLSLFDAIRDIVQLDYTIHPDIVGDPYHIDIIKQKMTNRLTTILPAIIEEIVLAFEESTNIGPEWGEIDHVKVMTKCIMRTTNRMFVGAPMCRNQVFLDDIMEYINKTSVSAEIISLAPNILRPIVAKLVINTKKVLQRIIDVVSPEFERRTEKLKREGDKWTDRPEDLIQWIIEYAPPGSTVKDMCYRILAMNFAAIHTSYLASKHALLDIATNPQLQEPLREEIEEVVKKYGWTKQGLSMMKKLDSVLRESQRLNSITITALWRKAKVDHTFCDGTFVPKGTIVIVPSSAIHHSEKYYENPDEFDGLKWSKLREENPELKSQYQMVKTEDHYLPFGHGKHSCPGRFFAANELKVLLSYIICNYEVRVVGGKRPPNQYFSLFACVPDETAKIEFKERPDRKESQINKCI